MANSTTPAAFPAPPNAPHDNRQGLFIAVNIASVVLATVATAARLYTRGFIVRSWGKDDWALLGAALCFIGETAASLEYIKYLHMGYHIWDVPPDAERTRHGLKMRYIVEILYNPVLTFTKASILFFYLRITPNKTFHRWVWGTMLFNLALFIGTFLATMLQCVPIPYTWNKAYPGGGYCYAPQGLYLSTAVLATLTDTWILVTPLPVLWGLQLPRRKKVVLTGLFSIGAVVVVLSIVRLVAFKRYLFDTVDMTYDDFTVWSPLECSFAIVSASVPALRPLFSKLLPRFFSTVGPSAYVQSGNNNNETIGGGGGSRAGKKSVRLDTIDIAMETVAGKGKGAGDSQEEILGYGGERRRTVDMV
ncbi:hypothetical protein EDC01DRAFT_780391 [Geopyxis carbonaria]|nr:hypothetical protein EDC01DRAFT_780391 [Geopyxis carbonaria]